jgi:hypothetical protein
MQQRSSEGGRLQTDIDRLKDPRPYQEQFETQQVQALTQAIDILWRLAREAHDVDATKVGLDKLTDAKLYLDKLLHEQLGDPEKEN